MLSRIQKDLVITVSIVTSMICRNVTSIIGKSEMCVILLSNTSIDNAEEIYSDLLQILVYKEITYVTLHGIITLFQEDWDKLVVEANTSIQALTC